MKKSTQSFPALVLLAGMGLASSASATLIAEDGGALVYDTGLNIIWLANANLAATNHLQASVGAVFYRELPGRGKKPLPQ